MKSLIINVTRFNCIESYFLTFYKKRKILSNFLNHRFHSFLIKLALLIYGIFFPKFPNSTSGSKQKTYSTLSSKTRRILIYHVNPRYTENRVQKRSDPQITGIEWPYRKEEDRRGTLGRRQQPQKRFLPACGACNAYKCNESGRWPGRNKRGTGARGSDSMRLVNATLNHDRRHGQWAQSGEKVVGSGGKYKSPAVRNNATRIQLDVKRRGARPRDRSFLPSILALFVLFPLACILRTPRFPSFFT